MPTSPPRRTTAAANRPDRSATTFRYETAGSFSSSSLRARFCVGVCTRERFTDGYADRVVVPCHPPLMLIARRILAGRPMTRDRTRVPRPTRALGCQSGAWPVHAHARRQCCCSQSQTLEATERAAHRTHASVSACSATGMLHRVVVVPSLVLLTARSSPSRVERSGSQVHEIVSNVLSVALSSLRRNTTYFGRRVESWKERVGQCNSQRSRALSGGGGASSLGSCVRSLNCWSPYVHPRRRVRRSFLQRPAIPRVASSRCDRLCRSMQRFIRTK